MNTKLASTLWAAAALYVANVVPAIADATVIVHTTMNSPQLTQMEARMNPQQRAAMDAKMSGMMTSTTYISGLKSRVNTGSFMSMIMDAGAQTMTILLPSTHTYVTTPIDPDMVKREIAAAMASSGAPGGMPNMQYKVVDTGRSTTFLGHKCRHYTATMTMPMPQVGSVVMHMNILAAQDLPVDPRIFSALSMQAGLGTNSVNGVPILIETTMTSSSPMLDGMMVKQEATGINTNPVLDSVFAIPDGYTATTMQNLMQGASAGAVR
ncbi:MAG: hypothetical protein ACLQVD_07745 [Capsulimonadaceae bacterium]